MRSGVWEQVTQELLIFAGAGVFLRENIEYRLISNSGLEAVIIRIL